MSSLFPEDLSMLFPNKPASVIPLSCGSSLPFRSCRRVLQSILGSCCKLIGISLAAVFGQLNRTRSICTGALFLGSLGIFNGKFCTTHWFAYDDLKERVKSAALASGGQPGRVVKARFVDSGLNESGIRVISSGGISCGIDASLYLVKLLLGEEEAISTAELLDYAYRKTEGVVIDDD